MSSEQVSKSASSLIEKICNDDRSHQILKLAGVSLIGLGLNHIITEYLLKREQRIDNSQQSRSFPTYLSTQQRGHNNIRQNKQLTSFGQIGLSQKQSKIPIKPTSDNRSNRPTITSIPVQTRKLISEKDSTYEEWNSKCKDLDLKIDDKSLLAASLSGKNSNNSLGMNGSQFCWNFNTTDGLLVELKLLTKALCDLEKVNNLIVDLKLENPKTYPCPLIAYKPKQTKDEPYLMLEAVVKPGEFLIKKCAFRPGEEVGNERKYMRAGPRNTQFFNASDVRADIVVLGKLCPGINTIIRELTIMLKNVYKVQNVYGVKNSFQGYYDYEEYIKQRNGENMQKGDENVDMKNHDGGFHATTSPSLSIIELKPEMLQTIHHRGGSFLGMRKTQFNPKIIVDNLERRCINQVYLIGASNTLKSATLIYQEIKSRNLAISICVLLKAINRDVALFDTCFGFESAVEETQRFIEMSYVAAKSYHNTVTLIKVPGYESGFLACDAASAARNVNICLVPEFPYCFYGEKGLLRYITERIKHKGSCVIVYAEGTYHAVLDIDPKYQTKQAFDHFLKKEISNTLDSENLIPNSVLLTDTDLSVRSVKANSLDTKLCCQVAHSSINCMMCGYTNFVCGHFSQKNAMVPIPEMMEVENKYQLRPEDESWQRLIASTGQPSFLNSEYEELKNSNVGTRR